jgi:DNA invertase Pin-like site-specific DNA recombinase
MIKRTAIYLRVSDEDEEQSLNEQEPILREDLKIAGERENADFQITHVLKEDAGKKGWSEDRSEFKKLKRIIQQGLVEVIAVKELSRLFRNAKIAIEFLELLSTHKIEIRVRQSRVDIETSSGRLLYMIMAAVHDAETTQNSERCRSSIRSQFKRGKLHGRPVLKGYYKVEVGAWAIDKKESAEIKVIFEIFNRNLSYKLTIQELESRGLKTKKGKVFSQSQLKSTITNKSYVGIFGYKDEFEIEKPELKIISNELFDETQKNIDTVEKKYYRKNKVSDRVFPLVGLLKSPTGNGYSGKSANSRGRKYYYYNCAREKKSVDAITIEQSVINVIKQVKKDGDLKKQAKKLKRVIETEESVLKNTISESHKKIKDCEKLERNIVNKILRFDDYNELLDLANNEIKKIKEEKEELLNLIENLKRKVFELKSDESSIHSQVDLIDDEIDSILYHSDLKRIRGIFRKLFSKIVLNLDTKSIDVWWELENNGVDFQLKNNVMLSIQNEKEEMLKRLLGNTPEIIETTPLYKLHIFEKMTTKEMAKKLGVSRSTVSKYMKIYKIPRKGVGVAKNRKRGLAFGRSNSAWGYKDNTREQKIIEEIVRLRETEVKGRSPSYQEIANSLNGMAVPTKTGKGKWHARTVHSIYMRHNSNKI